MEITFRVILILLFLAFIAHRGYYTRKIKIAQEESIDERKNDTLSMIANLLALSGLGSVLLYSVAPSWMSWSSLPLPTWLRWLGVLIAALGFGLLQWSHFALGQNWSDTPRITASQELVTAGPYRWIRHPIYTAFLLILGSTLLISANWFIGGAWIAATAMDIFSRIRYEEEKMGLRFGDAYRDYTKRTGRLLPRL